MSSGTRVYKKCSPNGNITTYLGKRDYIDHTTHTDPIDGVVLIDPESLEEKKVFVQLLCAFRYGREDLDVLGLSFRKDFCSKIVQIFPPLNDDDKIPKTTLQERLMKKLGVNSYPFFIEIPKDSPCSVALQPAAADTKRACGVDYELRTYCAEKSDDKMHKRSCVRLAIRKVQYAPEKKGPQPTVELQKRLGFSDKLLCLEATLDKELYYHGETINVNVQVTNNSSKTVKKIKISVRQIADICLFSNAQYKCQVANVDADDQVAPSSNLCKVYQICPLLADNKEKRGLALDGQLKHEDTNLASSTLLKEGTDKENLGIIVQYKAKVKLLFGSFGLSFGEMYVELPFVLMHPKPAVEQSSLSSKKEKEEAPDPKESGEKPPLDHNVISFETNNTKNPSDDIVFEDFARLRLQGAKSKACTML